MRLRQRLCDTGAFEIWLDCVGYDKKTMPYCNDIIKHFSKDQREFFFGFSRTDGINLTKEECAKYGDEIPCFFRHSGRFESVMQAMPQKRDPVVYESQLIVASIPINNQLYNMLPKIFHYYLETTLFSPKIHWKTFKELYSNYMKCGSHGYVMNGYTDIMFSYVDSGDFFIELNPNIYDVDAVCREVEQIITS